VLAAERDGHQLALMFIDLDDFKRINDTLGHDIGDDVLAQFGMRILDAAKVPDDGHTEIARFGGDEFVALLHGTEVRDRASRLAQIFLAQLRQPITVGGQSIVLAASIGITLYPQDGTLPATLLKNADIAMYRAKLDGKNCLRFYTRDMDMAIEREMQLEQDLHLALDRGELSVVYQPIHSLQSERIIGAEALVRWEHPQRGYIAPELFIAVAEQTGQIEAVGQFVLKVACADAATWPAVDGVAPFVSVNISARQLRQGVLPAQVEAELGESGLPAARLHLELTETTMFSLEHEAIAACARLRAAGVKIWLDDFGTGFSGLSHLRRVPVDGVKIDRSFVSGMLDDADDLALTAAIIAMAHSLGIVVTAEGVESQGQVDALKARGCDNLQGFLLGHPMSDADLVRELGG
jgi:diguanylate cyclase (GGDEF)-like protein